MVKAWRHAVTGGAGSGGGFGFGVDGSGGAAIEGMAAANLHAKEEEMSQHIQGLTYRRRYIALRPVFREIFNKFDAKVRSKATWDFSAASSTTHWPIEMNAQLACC